MNKTNNRFGEPWKRQRVLKKEIIPSQNQIYMMADSFKDLMERSLFIMAYFTAGRITEIIKTNNLYENEYEWEDHFDFKQQRNIKRILRNDNGSPKIKKRIKKPINYPGIKKEDFIIKEVSGKTIMEVRMANRKNKQYGIKVVPIPISKEANLYKLLEEYLDTLSFGDALFPFATTKARKILAKVNMNPHFLRDIRLTHMVTEYDFNAFQLVRFAGWKNISPAERYIRMSMKDLVRNF